LKGDLEEKQQISAKWKFKSITRNCFFGKPLFCVGIFGSARNNTFRTEPCKSLWAHLSHRTAFAVLCVFKDISPPLPGISALETGFFNKHIVVLIEEPNSNQD